jgi:CBS domain-containing protein
MKVKDIMTRDIGTCRPHDSLAAAAKLMWDRDIGAVPVVDPEGKVIGLITDRDICMAAHFTGEPIALVAVSHAMSKTVVAADPEQSVEAAEQLMAAKQIRRLPVTQGEKLVGMLSLSDIARTTTVAGHELRETDELAQTLGRIVLSRATPGRELRAGGSYAPL